MKNLSLLNLNVRDYSCEALQSEEKSCICYGTDGETKNLYVCYLSPVGSRLSCFDQKVEEEWFWERKEPSGSPNRPVNLTYFSFSGDVCLGLQNGELIMIDDWGKHSDLVRTCDDGIQAMEWSPDQEILVLVTKSNTLLMMSRTFDVLYQTSLDSQEFGEKEFITVGWGKKETQFHGKEGKGARAQAEAEADPQVFDSTVKITWRGDGKLFAVGFSVDGSRRFKVFDQDGHLQYTSERQPGLESNIAWRPSGNVIATTQRLPNKYVVAFFEKNGLKHGEFDIPVNGTTVVEDIAWSPDSEILTLLCKDTATNSHRLLLFTVSNYHWYWKQTLDFNSHASVKKIFWDGFDKVSNKTLHVVCKNGQHLVYTWVWRVDHSVGKSSEDDAVTAVIDGHKLLVTGLRQSVVPPPMAALELDLGSPINSVNFVQEQIGSNNFFVITSDGRLVFFEQTEKFPLQYREAKTVTHGKQIDFPLQCYNWHWLNRQTLLCISANVKDDPVDLDHMPYGSTYYIEEFRFTSPDSDHLEYKGEFKLSAPVFRIQSHPVNKAIAFLQSNTGELYQYSTGGKVEMMGVDFDEPCPEFSVVSIDNAVHFVGLSLAGKLCIDEMKMASPSVSSFFVHTHFLLVATLQHTLLCAELNDAGLRSVIDYGYHKSDKVYVREIERGAKLVIAVPKDTRVVFQMPRGNLETIQPRPLSLKTIGALLDELKYAEAFDLMRKQRINLNLNYDHDPEKFTDNINVFLETLENNSWLSLFISDLENVDVTKTMYKSSYAEKTKQQDTSTKVQKICELVRYHLSLRSDTDERILPVLTSYVKTNSVEDIESALSLIKGLQTRESAGSDLPVGSDEALKYLLYMVDVGNLFDVALGMYDFDLVLFVANKSQKDPKEFIPMLNDLAEMDESYRRFAINKHLKRFDKAVRCLVEYGPEKHEELATFVKYHSLYREALSLLSPEQGVYRQISDDFGHYLSLKKQFVEAGIAFERGGNFGKAVECYKDALEWELAVNLAQKWPKEKFQELCLDLVNGLREEQRHKEALTILEQFYEDKEECIRYAIEAGRYLTALRLCNGHTKHELKEASLVPALEEDQRNLLELIQNNHSTFVHHRDRLTAVREEKRKRPTEVFDPTYANKDSDLYSDAGSTLASSRGSSSRSYRSSKNRRKHERKLASLKEGSQYEDVALVMALHSLVTSSFDLRPRVKEVNTVLSCLGKNNEASDLQAALEKLLREMRESFRSIWTEDLAVEAATAALAASNAPDGVATIPQGIASLDPQLRTPPVIRQMNWKLDGLF